MSELHKFLFDGLPVRGLLVRLTGDWREVLERRESAQDAFPAPVRELLGEMAAAGVLMQSNIKFDGALVMQIHGEGPVKLTVAEVKSDLSFRVTAKVTGEMPAVPRLDTLVNVNGKGRCAITLDPRQKLPGQQPYQGIVALHGDHGEPLHRLSEVLEHYMLQSEQLDTKLVLAANDEVAAGLLIQRLPVEGAGNLGGRASAGPPQAGPAPSGGSTAEPAWGRSSYEDDIGRDEDYRRISMLAATLTSEELLTLDANTILRRLFWEEKVVRYEPVHPQFACSCSRERVGNMLKTLGREEIDGIVVEQGRVEIGCDFCGVKYHFDVVDVGELFTPQSRQQPGTTTLN
jgi:molecular chaperone Hsp33